MNMSEFAPILRRTLDDYRVSRGEQRVLRELLAERKLDDGQLAALRHEAFSIARGEVGSPDEAGVLNWLEEIMRILAPAAQARSRRVRSEAKFSPGKDCLNAILSRLRRARHSIGVCVFTITDDRITDAILASHQRHLHLRIITDNAKSADPGSDVQRLVRAGIPVRMDRSEYHMHHKFAVFDTKALVTGSYNWTRSAAAVNEENIIVSNDPRLVTGYANEFNRLWERLG